LGGVNGVGAYVTVSWNGTSYDVTPAAVSPESQFIQPWQSFMVHTTGAAGTLTIKESDKTNGPVNNVYRTTTSNIGLTQTTSDQQGLRITLESANDDQTTSLLDEVLTTYSKQYSNKIDELDAIKMMNLNENLSLYRSGQNLSIERRSLASAGDTISLGLSNTTQRSYVLQFTPLNLNTDVQSAYLEDAYLHSTTPIDLKGITQIPFTINGDPAAQDGNRFRVVLMTTSKQTINGSLTTAGAVIASPNPLTGRTINIYLNNQPAGTYRVMLVNDIGQILLNSQIRHEGGSSTYSLNLSQRPSKGVYHLQVSDHKNANTTLRVVVN
jgi:hypothetical protein